jgi:hypothetical protein
MKTAENRRNRWYGKATLIRFKGEVEQHIFCENKNYINVLTKTA